MSGKKELILRYNKQRAKITIVKVPKGTVVKEVDTSEA